MKSYLKFLSRNKLYTAVQAAGLVISLAFVILIGNYVWQQCRVAHENPLGKRIYAIGNDRYMGLSWWEKAEIEARLPEAEAVCRVGSPLPAWADIDGVRVHAVHREVDAEFFDFFPGHSLLSGSLEEFALKGRCLVSASWAEKYLDGDPIGRELRVVDEYVSEEDAEKLTVCGVFGDFGDTMLPRTDILLNAAFSPYSAYPAFSTFGQYLTLVKVGGDADGASVAEKLRAVCREHYPEAWIPEFLVLTLDELYFFENQHFFRRGNRSVLRMLAAMALLLLVSAVINAVNLNAALSGRRAKEMATRRLLGASRAAVFGRYLGESLMFTLVCGGLALLAAFALRPLMDSLLYGITVEDVEMDWEYLPLRLSFTPGMVAACGLLLLLLGLVVGMVPAVTALRFAPLDVVRGRFRRQTKMVFSKVFIVLQNSISVVLIALSLVMEGQMRHMENRPLHSRREGLYRLECYARTYEDILPLVHRLERIPQVRRIGYGSGLPGRINMAVYVNSLQRQDVQCKAMTILCDDTYFDLLGLEIMEDEGVPHARSLWMSASLARELSLTDSLKNAFARMSVNRVQPEAFGGTYHDFPTADAASPSYAYSMILVGRSEDIMYGNGLLIEVEGDRKAAAPAIRAAYADYSLEKNGISDPPYLDGWLDDIVKAQLRPLRTAARLLEFFMVLSVLISLLGLMAMSTYFSGENTKSIAIRKVFGSPVSRELWRSVAEYMKWVALALVIGLPVAAFLAGRYLEQYEYRISGYGWELAAAALLSAGMAFGSVLWQTLRAARTDPAKELKKE